MAMPLTDMFVIISKTDPRLWLTHSGFADTDAAPEARVFADKDTANTVAKASGGVVITCRQFVDFLTATKKQGRR